MLVKIVSFCEHWKVNESDHGMMPAAGTTA